MNEKPQKQNTAGRRSDEEDKQLWLLKSPTTSSNFHQKSLSTGLLTILTLLKCSSLIPRSPAAVLSAAILTNPVFWKKPFRPPCRRCWQRFLPLLPYAQASLHKHCGGSFSMRLYYIHPMLKFSVSVWFSVSAPLLPPALTSLRVLSGFMTRI